jgi:cell division protein FtsL
MNIKPLLLLTLFLPFSIVFAQQKDSLTLEMERLNRLGDSLHKEQLKRDSANQQMLNNIGRDIERIKEESNQKQIEQATEEVMRQRKKEQGGRRKIMWIGLFIVIAITSAAGIYFQRKRNKT